MGTKFSLPFIRQKKQEIRELVSGGLSMRAAARAVNVNESTARNWFKNEPKEHDPEQDIRIAYDAICIFKRRNDGNAPTRDEIAEATGFSRTKLHGILNVLEQRGKIERCGDHNQARKIIVVGGQWIPPTDWREPVRLPVERRHPRLSASRRKALYKVDRLCGCENGEAIYRKRYGKRKGDVILLCERCADWEREADGETGLERI